jgi:hypothetical protein
MLMSGLITGSPWVASRWRLVTEDQDRIGRGLAHAVPHPQGEKRELTVSPMVSDLGKHA